MHIRPYWWLQTSDSVELRGKSLDGEFHKFHFKGESFPDPLTSLFSVEKILPYDWVIVENGEIKASTETPSLLNYSPPERIYWSLSFTDQIESIVVHSHGDSYVINNIAANSTAVTDSVVPGDTTVAKPATTTASEMSSDSVTVYRTESEESLIEQFLGIWIILWPQISITMSNITDLFISRALLYGVNTDVLDVPTLVYKNYFMRFHPELPSYTLQFIGNLFLDKDDANLFEIDERLKIYDRLESICNGIRCTIDTILYDTDDELLSKIFFSLDNEICTPCIQSDTSNCIPGNATLYEIPTKPLPKALMYDLVAYDYQMTIVEDISKVVDEVSDVSNRDYLLEVVNIMRYLPTTLINTIVNSDYVPQAVSESLNFAGRSLGQTAEYIYGMELDRVPSLKYKAWINFDENNYIQIWGNKAYFHGDMIQFPALGSIVVNYVLNGMVDMLDSYPVEDFIVNERDYVIRGDRRELLDNDFYQGIVDDTLQKINLMRIENGVQKSRISKRTAYKL